MSEHVLNNRGSLPGWLQCTFFSYSTSGRSQSIKAIKALWSVLVDWTLTLTKSEILKVLNKVIPPRGAKLPHQQTSVLVWTEGTSSFLIPTGKLLDLIILSGKWSLEGRNVLGICHVGDIPPQTKWKI